MEADMKSDSPRHEEVVVSADERAVCTVRFSLIDKEFVESTPVSFSV